MIDTTAKKVEDKDKVVPTPRFILQEYGLVAQGQRFGSPASSDDWKSTLRFLYKNDLLDKFEETVKGVNKLQTAIKVAAKPKIAAKAASTSIEEEKKQPQ